MHGEITVALQVLATRRATFTFAGPSAVIFAAARAF
jgi:hypothetical protein